MHDNIHDAACVRNSNTKAREREGNTATYIYIIYIFFWGYFFFFFWVYFYSCMCLYRQQEAALQMVVNVLRLPSSILDKDGSEMTLAMCSLEEFAEIIKDHLLSNGQDMHAHDIDIHAHVRYFDEPAPNNPDRTITYAKMFA